MRSFLPLLLTIANGAFLDSEDITREINEFLYPKSPSLPISKHLRDSQNLFVIIVDTSRYYHNIRHAVNAFTIYKMVKELGVPDDRIITFVGDSAACDPRNAFFGSLFTDSHHLTDVYKRCSPNVEFSGSEVTAANFLRLLEGRYKPYTPFSSRFHEIDLTSNLFIYLSGHSGTEFTKFRDFEEISSFEINKSFLQKRFKNQYREILTLVDSCKAATLGNQIDVPNFALLSTSGPNENAYSVNHDSAVGQSLMDKFTYRMFQYYKRKLLLKNKTVDQFLELFDPNWLNAHPNYNDSKAGKKHELLDFMKTPPLRVEFTPGSLLEKAQLDPQLLKKLP